MKTKSALIRRAEKSLVNRGVIGTFHYCVRAVRDSILSVTPSKRQARAHWDAMSVEFDRKFNVDTKGRSNVAEYDIDSKNWVYGTGYGPVNETDFIKTLQGRKLPWHEFTFIDFGSGKGRAVLLAATFPFKKVIGVEFSPELHTVAQENLRHFRMEDRQSKNVEFICMDVADYQLPESLLVLFLNHPFEGPMMKDFVDKVKRSYANHPRRMIVLYFEPKHPQFWDEAEFLTKVQAFPAIYETKHS